MNGVDITSNMLRKHARECMCFSFFPYMHVCTKLKYKDVGKHKHHNQFASSPAADKSAHVLRCGKQTNQKGEHTYIYKPSYMCAFAYIHTYYTYMHLFICVYFYVYKFSHNLQCITKTQQSEKF